MILYHEIMYGLCTFSYTQLVINDMFIGAFDLNIFHLIANIIHI